MPQIFECIRVILETLREELVPPFRRMICEIVTHVKTSLDLLALRLPLLAKSVRIWPRPWLPCGSRMLGEPYLTKYHRLASEMKRKGIVTYLGITKELGQEESSTSSTSLGAA
jgi:hypothetical protein